MLFVLSPYIYEDPVYEQTLSLLVLYPFFLEL